MYGSNHYNRIKEAAHAALRDGLTALIDRCDDPLTANLTKDEAIWLLQARVRQDFGNLVFNTLDDWKLHSAVARAE